MSEPLNPSATESSTGAERPVRLREAREAAGLHIAALAAALKVPVKKLEALEAGRYDELPDMTFARALASSACRHLKIDPAPVLAQIPLGHRPQLGDATQAINAPFKGAGDPAPLNPVGWLSRPAVLAAIALLLGALVLLFMPERLGSPQADAVMPPSTTPVAPPAVVTVEPSQPPAGTASAAVDATQSASTLTVATTAAPLTTTTPQASVAAQDAANAALLRITGTGESWVEVANGTGTVVARRMLTVGDVIEFSAAPPYSVVLGRADAAQVTVRGQPFDVTPYARNSVARFEVK
jgi:cytoskeleton protein RodZ